MAGLVDRVRGHLTAHEIEEALDLLITTWQAERAPAIAAVIDAIDAIDAIDRAEETPEPLDFEAWTAAARQATTHRERGALLRAIAKRSTGDLAMAMTIAVALNWDDPRLGSQIIELLTTIPFSGKRTRDVWRAVFDAAKAQRDPRFLAVAKSLPQTWNVGADTKTFLGNRLKDAIEGLAEAAMPAEARALAQLAAELAPPPIVETAAELLAAIYANPDDDQARLVYADWLQERGDPRGELIALQMQPDDKRDRKAETALLKQHKKAWLGPLAPVLLGDVEFRRGFVAKGTARFRHQRDAEQLGGLREWATLEELEFKPSGARHDQEAWTRFVHPAMCGLRIVKFPDVRWLVAAEQPWRIEELWIDPIGDEVRELCAATCLPRLRHLVARQSDPGDFEGLASCPPHVTVIDAIGFREDRRAAWLAIAEQLPLERFTILWFSTGEVHHHFSRDTDHALTRLDIELRHTKSDEPSEYELRSITQAIESLQRGTFTHFDARFVRGDETRPVGDLLRAGKKLLRQAGQDGAK